MTQPFDAALLSSASHLNGSGIQGDVPVSGGFLAPNSGSSSGSGFLPLVSPYSPPESASTVGGVGRVYVNGMNGRVQNGVPQSR